MRDPKRIERILEKLKNYWLEHPDLRLCQILGNITGAGDNYYVEDGIIEAALTEKPKGEKNAKTNDR